MSGVTAPVRSAAPRHGPVTPAVGGGTAGAAGRAGAPWRRPGWWAPLAPALATVLLLCAPVQAGDVSASGKVTAADGASVVLVAWCVLRLLRARGRGPAGPDGRRGAPLTPLAAVLLGAPVVAFAVATAASADPAASLPGFVRYVQVFVLVPGALLLSLRDARDFRLVCGALVLLGLVQGGVGVWQNLSGTGASYMGEDVRAVGTFGPLDVMGMATVVSYGLVAALALGAGAPADAPRWQRPAALACAGALAVPLALSYSRGAWIATAAACLVVLVLSGLRRALPYLALVLAAGVVLTAVSGGAGTTGGGGGGGGERAGVAGRLASITDVSGTPDRSVSDRYSLWSAAVGIWREAPATGVGLKGFPAHRDTHASLGLSSGSDTAGAGQSFQREPLLSPHNMYLLLLSEQGLVGTTALVGGWAALLVLALRRLRPRAGGGARPHARDCGLAAAGLLVWQAVDFLYSDIGGPSTVLTAVVLGLVAWWALARHTDVREGARR